MLPGERVSKCYRAIVPGRVGVDVVYLPDHQRARFEGFQVCGSVWACPVCAARITESRRVELTEALRAAGGQGLRVLFVTYTTRHGSRHKLPALVRDLVKARGAAVSGGAAVRMYDRYGIVGQVRALEVTHGENGWHPHLHELLFIDPAVAASDDLAALEELLRSRWLVALRSVGLDADSHGVDLRDADQDLAGYVAKFGREPAWSVEHEMSKAPVKCGRRGSRTPMQLLAAATFDDDKQAGDLYVDYVRAFHGRRQLVWSRGLRARLLSDRPEVTDQEVAEDAGEKRVYLATLSVDVVRAMLRQQAHAVVLDAGSSGDAAAVRACADALMALERDRSEPWTQEDWDDVLGRAARATGEAKARTERPNASPPVILQGWSGYYPWCSAGRPDRGAGIP